MASPVPKHLTTDEDHKAIAARFLNHVSDIRVSAPSTKARPTGRHRAKYAPGLATALLKLAGTKDVGDPMAGTGMLAWETGVDAALNDIDPTMSEFIAPMSNRCEVSYLPANMIQWSRGTCIFSPPYYPKTDRRKPCAHNDNKRGPVVGFRDAYDCDHPAFIGNPGGVNAIAHYRQQMTDVYRHLLTSVCGRMIVVTKNWTRLGVEMRLDLDTILMAEGVGWTCTARHGWTPPQSLWSRFNEQRGGGVLIEDITVFTDLGPSSARLPQQSTQNRPRFT